MSQPESPLARAAFLILLALAGGDKHGYAIMQEARSLSDEGFQMGPATLYTNIQRLLDSGWIAEVAGPKGSDSRRRYYRLTRDGNSLLESELGRMENLIRKARLIRKAKSPGRLRPAESAS